MTQARDFAPVLDRLLQRETTTTVEVPGATGYVFNARYTGGGNDNLDDGTWTRDSDTQITIGLNDSNGLPFPDDLSIPASGVEVSWDGAAFETFTLTAFLEVRTGFSNTVTALRLTFDGPLPAAGTALTITVESGGTQTVTQTATRSVWAARRDFLGRDFLRVGAISDTQRLIGIASSRFVVRADGPAWAIGDIFTDDKGASQTVQSVGEVGGRRRWLELLTQSTG